MVEPVFFLYVTLSILSFGIMSPLMVYCSRKHSPLIVAVYRNLSFVVTMAPLLFFVPLAEIIRITHYIPTLLIAASLGALAFISGLQAAAYLPLSISASFARTASLITAIALGFVFLNEILTPKQLLLFVLLLSAVVGLSVIRNNHTHLDPSKTPLGIAIALTAGSIGATGFFFFAKLAQSVHPLVASYFWEVTIGFFALLYMIILRVLKYYSKDLKLPAKDILQIALFTLPAIAGTTFFALAVNSGPFVLASGLTISSVAIATLVSWFLFNEKLRVSQLLLITAVLVIIFLIRTSS